MVAEKAVRGFRRNWTVWVALGCTVPAFVWLRVVGWFISNEHGCAPPTYYPKAGTTIDYSELLSRHSTKFLDPGNPALNCVGLVALIVIAAALIRISNKRWMTIVAALPAGLFMCLASLGAFGSCISDYTKLHDLQTAEFDHRVYHLTYASGLAGGLDVPYEELHLFECDTTGDTCRLYQTLQTYGIQKPMEASLAIDSSLNQLQVRAGGETIFTIDASTIDAPNLMLNAEPISEETAKQIVELSQLNYGTISALAWSSSEPIMATAGENGIWLHRFSANGVETHFLEGSGSTFDLAFSPDGQKLASIDLIEGPLYLWNVETNAQIGSLAVSYANAVAFSPDGTILASGSFHGVVFYDLKTLSEIGSLDEGYVSIRKIVFSPSGDLLACSGFDYVDGDGRGYVSVWDVSSRTELIHIRGYHSDPSNGLAFSSDSRLLAFPTQENRNPDIYPNDNETMVHIQDVSTGTELFSLRLPEQEQAVNDLAFSPDGTVLATANGNNIVLWSVATGSQLVILKGHIASVSGVAFSSEGTFLASASYDGTIRLWGVESR